MSTDNKKVEIISFGATFKGILSSFGMLNFLVGIFIIIVNWIIGLVIISVALIFLLSIKGVIIDYDNRKIKSYINLLIIKIGVWISLDNFTNIQICKINESMGMYSRGTNTRVNTKSFDIYIYNKENANSLLIKSCRKPNDATAHLKEYAIKLNMKIDHNIKDISFRKKN